MHALKATVRAGRLTLDEPTDLPEGAVVTLVALEDLDEKDRARLHASIDRGMEDARAGRVTDARVVVAKLRATATPR